MEHIAGLTAKGVECATKLREQLERGLITYPEFVDELSSVRRNHVLPGHMWVITLEGWIFTKVIVRSNAYVPDFGPVGDLIDADQGEDAGFQESPGIRIDFV